MKAILFSIPFIILVFAMGSCEYNVAEELYPDENCDTISAPSYAQKVKPILDMHCTGCHSGSSPSGDIPLETYLQVKEVVDIGSFQCAIWHMDDCAAMPEDEPRLSDCKLKKIDRWIDAGADDN